jgi:30S ribosomal protein 3
MKNLEINTNFFFKILWSNSCIGIAVDQVDNRKDFTPLTSFYFWPREDGWKLLKSELDSKPWMSQKVKEELLNSYTSIVNLWLKNLNTKIKIENIEEQTLDLKLKLLAKN